MDAPLAVGLKFSDTFVVPTSKTVPNLYPEAAEFQDDSMGTFSAATG